MSVNSMCFVNTDEGSCVVTASDDGTMVLWKLHAVNNNVKLRYVLSKTLQWQIKVL